MKPSRLVAVLVAAAVAAAVAFVVLRQQRRDAALAARLGTVVDTFGRRGVPCSELAPRGTRVLLALGQSNAGNHGNATAVPGEPIRLFASAGCLWAADPLPGSTGAGGSIWSRLPDALARHGDRWPTLISAIGVDATSIDDWTRPQSPLRAHLARHLQAMVQAGLKPDLVLWLQGESDARLGVEAPAYRAGLTSLAALLQASGIDSPIVLSLSTRCRSEPDAEVRSAIAAAVDSDPRFRLGPDLDTVWGSVLRRDACHLTAAGLDQAADLWAASIGAVAPKAPSAASYPAH